MSKLYGARIKQLAAVGRRGIELPGPATKVTRSNPMCGDTVTVALGTDRARVELGYSARGCLICLAACAHMQEHYADVDPAELAASVAAVNRMFAGDQQIPAAMELFAPVAAHRSRHQCVLLPYLALEELLKKD